MSSTKIPTKLVVALWTRAGGRCEYPGHNASLWRDELTNKDINAGLIAHIVADNPDGPRGHPTRSKELASDISNLMLLCHAHHRLIDSEGLADHPEEVLLSMKRDHEQRIADVTAIAQDRRTHVLVMTAPIDNQRPVDDVMDMKRAVLSRLRYPTDLTALPLNLLPATERRSEFWTRSRAEIEDFFETRVRWRLLDSTAHTSVFGLAPIPLLIFLGKLVGDKTAVDVYQRHREPTGWAWPETRTSPIEFELIETSGTDPSPTEVSLALSISDTIPREHLQRASPAGAPVYEMTIADPRRDCVRQPEDLTNFRHAWAKALNRIRAVHMDTNPVVRVLPAVPNAIAIEMGRTILPKAHDRLDIYDFNQALGGFTFAFRL